MVVFTIYTMVDGFFVARYEGELALSSVNIALPFVNTLFSVAILFGIGTQTIIGVERGRGDLDSARRIFTFITLCVSVFSLLIAVLSSLFVKEIVLFLGATDILMEDAVNYLRIIIYFSGFFIVSYNLEVLVKIDGFPVFSTIGVITSAIVNIALDYVFVGLMGKGVSGAAIATGLSQAVAVVIYLIHFIWGRANLRFVKISKTWKTVKEKFKLLVQIFTLSFGDFMSEMGVGMTLFLYNKFLIVYAGELAVATFTVIAYVGQIVAMCFAGVVQGTQPLVSYYFGAKDKKSYTKLYKYCLTSMICIGLVSTGLLLFFAENIYHLFFGDIERSFLMSSALAMRKFSVAFLAMGINVIVAGFASAIMKARYSIMINFGRSFLFLFLSLWILSTYFGESGIWFATALAEVITLVFSLGFMWRIRKQI